MVASRCGGSTAYATLPMAPLADPMPVELPTFVAPTITSVLPMPTMPVEAVPLEAVPVETVPVEAIPVEAVLDEAVLDEAVLDEALLDEAVPVGAASAVVNRRPWIVRHWTLPVAAAMLVLAYLTLRGHLPSLGSMVRTFSSADVRWLTVAVVLEAISNGMFARQQRALLRALGVKMSLARALGVTYARSALAITMPAGTAVSAAYALREYKRTGASTEKATAVMVLSGVLSVLGLGALYVLGIIGILVAEPVHTWHRHPILIIAGTAITAAGAIAWLVIRRARATRVIPADPTTATTASALPARRFDTIRIAIRQAVDAWRSLRVRDWSVAGLFAIVNWLTDMLCLVAAAKAFDLSVGLITIASVYLGVQLVRQIPLTPGGIGIVEAGLLAGLVSAGGATAGAAAVVLTYRVLSCWVLIPLGGLAWLGLRTRRPSTSGRVSLPAELADQPT
jgi:putative heme transporter